MGKEARSWDGPSADWPARRQRWKAGSCVAARSRGRPRTLPIVLLLAIVALCVPRTSLAADVPLLEDAVYHTDAGLLTLTAAQDLDAFGVDGLSVAWAADGQVEDDEADADGYVRLALGCHIGAEQTDGATMQVRMDALARERVADKVAAGATLHISVAAGALVATGGDASTAQLVALAYESCGDGAVRAGIEGCDTGSPADRTGCSARCLVETDAFCRTEPSGASGCMRLRNAIYFDGGDARIDVDAAATVDTCDPELSAIAWVRLSAEGAAPVLTQTDAFVFAVDADGHVQLTVGVDEATVCSVTGARRVDDNRWHSVGFRVTTDTCTLYVDYTTDGSAAASSACVSGGSTHIAHDAAEATFLHGYVQDVALWSYAVGVTTFVIEPSTYNNADGGLVFHYNFADRPVVGGTVADVGAASTPGTMVGAASYLYMGAATQITASEYDRVSRVLTLHALFDILTVDVARLAFRHVPSGTTVSLAGETADTPEDTLVRITLGSDAGDAVDALFALDTSPRNTVVLFADSGAMVDGLAAPSMTISDVPIVRRRRVPTAEANADELFGTTGRITIRGEHFAPYPTAVGVAVQAILGDATFDAVVESASETDIVVSLDGQGHRLPLDRATDASVDVCGLVIDAPDIGLRVRDPVVAVTSDRMYAVGSSAVTVRGSNFDTANADGNIVTLSFASGADDLVYAVAAQDDEGKILVVDLDETVLGEEHVGLVSASVLRDDIQVASGEAIVVGYVSPTAVVTEQPLGERAVGATAVTIIGQHFDPNADNVVTFFGDEGAPVPIPVATRAAADGMSIVLELNEPLDAALLGVTVSVSVLAGGVDSATANVFTVVAAPTIDEYVDARIGLGSDRVSISGTGFSVNHDVHVRFYSLAGTTVPDEVYVTPESDTLLVVVFNAPLDASMARAPLRARIDQSGSPATDVIDVAYVARPELYASSTRGYIPGASTLRIFGQDLGFSSELWPETVTVYGTTGTVIDARDSSVDVVLETPLPEDDPFVLGDELFFEPFVLYDTETPGVVIGLLIEAGFSLDYESTRWPNTVSMTIGVTLASSPLVDSDVTMTCTSLQPTIATVFGAAKVFTFDSYDVPQQVQVIPGPPWQSIGQVTIECVPDGLGRYGSDAVSPTTVVLSFFATGVRLNYAELDAPTSGASSLELTLSAPPTPGNRISVICTTDDAAVATATFQTYFFSNTDFAKVQDVRITPTGQVGTAVVTCSVTSGFSAGFNGFEFKRTTMHFATPGLVASSTAIIASSDGMAEFGLSLAASPHPLSSVSVFCRSSHPNVLGVQDMTYVFDRTNWDVSVPVRGYGTGAGRATITCRSIGSAGGYSGNERVMVSVTLYDQIAPTTTLRDEYVIGISPARVTVTLEPIDFKVHVVFDVVVSGPSVIQLRCDGCTGFDPSLSKLTVTNSTVPRSFSFDLLPALAAKGANLIQLIPDGTGFDDFRFKTRTHQVRILNRVEFIQPPTTMDVVADPPVPRQVLVRAPRFVEGVYDVALISDSEGEINCAYGCVGYEESSRRLFIDPDSVRDYVFYVQFTRLSTRSSKAILRLTPSPDLGFQSLLFPRLELSISLVATCFGVPSTDPSACSGRGSCVSTNECSCSPALTEDCGGCAPGRSNYPQCTPTQCPCQLNQASICMVKPLFPTEFECSCDIGRVPGNEEGTCDLVSVFTEEGIYAPTLSVDGVQQANEDLVLRPLLAPLILETVDFAWTQLSGPALDLAVDAVNGTHASETLTIPAGVLTPGAEYAFQVTVDGNLNSLSIQGSTSITLSVNGPPSDSALTLVMTIPDGTRAQHSEYLWRVDATTDDVTPWGSFEYQFSYRFVEAPALTPWAYGVDTEIVIRSWSIARSTTLTFPSEGTYEVIARVRDEHGGVERVTSGSVVVDPNPDVSDMATAVVYVSTSYAWTVLGDGTTIEAVRDVIGATTNQLATWPVTDADLFTYRQVLDDIVTRLFRLTITPDVTGLDQGAWMGAISLLAQQHGAHPDLELLRSDLALKLLDVVHIFVDLVDLMDDASAVDTILRPALQTSSALFCASDADDSALELANQALQDAVFSKMDRFVRLNGPPVSLQAGASSVTVRRFDRSSVAVRTFDAPSGAKASFTKQAIRRYATLYEHNFGAIVRESCQREFAGDSAFSPSVKVDLFQGSNLADGVRTPIDVRDLNSERITLTVPLTQTPTLLRQPAARYWDPSIDGWATDGLGSVVVAADGKTASFTTSHLTEFVLTLACLNTDEDEARGYFDPVSEQCACSTGYESSAGQDCDLYTAPSSCDVLDKVQPKDTTSEYLPTVSAGSLGSFIDIKVRSRLIEFGTVYRIEIRPIGGTATGLKCRYPGVGWTKSVDGDGVCYDSFDARLAFLYLTDPVLGCGLVRSETAEEYRYTGEVVISTATEVHLTTGDELERLVSAAYTIELVLTKVIRTSTSQLLVFGDTSVIPTAQLVEQTRNPGTGIVTLTFSTRISWPLRLQPAADDFNLATPPNKEWTGTVSEDSSSCGNTFASTCIQLWTFDVDPNGDCFLDGDYSISLYDVDCRPDALDPQCPLPQAETFGFQLTLASEDFCTDVVIDDPRLAPSASLSFFSDRDRTIAKTSFVLGELVVVDLVITPGEVAVSNSELATLTITRLGGSSMVLWDNAAATVDGNAHQVARLADTVVEFVMDHTVPGSIFDISDSVVPVNFEVNIIGDIYYADGQAKRVRQRVPVAFSGPRLRQTGECAADDMDCLMPTLLAVTQGGITIFPAGYQLPDGGYVPPDGADPPDGWVPGVFQPPADWSAPPDGFSGVDDNVFVPPTGWSPPPAGFQITPDGTFQPPSDYVPPPDGWTQTDGGLWAPPSGWQPGDPIDLPPGWEFNDDGFLVAPDDYVAIPGDWTLLPDGTYAPPPDYFVPPDGWVVNDDGTLSPPAGVDVDDVELPPGWGRPPAGAFAPPDGWIPDDDWTLPDGWTVQGCWFPPEDALIIPPGFDLRPDGSYLAPVGYEHAPFGWVYNKDTGLYDPPADYDGDASSVVLASDAWTIDPATGAVQGPSSQTPVPAEFTRVSVTTGSYMPPAGYEYPPDGWTQDDSGCWSAPEGFDFPTGWDAPDGWSLGPGSYLVPPEGYVAAPDDWIRNEDGTYSPPPGWVPPEGFEYPEGWTVPPGTGYFPPGGGDVPTDPVVSPTPTPSGTPVPIATPDAPSSVGAGAPGVGNFLGVPDLSQGEAAGLSAALLLLIALCCCFLLLLLVKRRRRNEAKIMAEVYENIIPVNMPVLTPIVGEEDEEEFWEKVQPMAGLPNGKPVKRAIAGLPALPGGARPGLPGPVPTRSPADLGLVRPTQTVSPRTAGKDLSRNAKRGLPSFLRPSAGAPRKRVAKPKRALPSLPPKPTKPPGPPPLVAGAVPDLIEAPSDEAVRRAKADAILNGPEADDLPASGDLTIDVSGEYSDRKDHTPRGRKKKKALPTMAMLAEMGATSSVPSSPRRSEQKLPGLVKKKALPSLDALADAGLIDRKPDLGNSVQQAQRKAVIDAAPPLPDLKDREHYASADEVLPPLPGLAKLGKSREELIAELQARRRAADALRQAELDEMAALQALVDAEMALAAGAADMDAAKLEALRQAAREKQRLRAKLLRRIAGANGVPDSLDVSDMPDLEEDLDETRLKDKAAVLAEIERRKMEIMALRQAHQDEIEALQALIDAEMMYEQGSMDLNEAAFADLRRKVRQRTSMHGKLIARQAHRRADDRRRTRAELVAELEARRRAADALRQAELDEMAALQAVVDAEMALEAGLADMDAAKLEALRQAAREKQRLRAKLLRRLARHGDSPDEEDEDDDAPLADDIEAENETVLRDKAAILAEIERRKQVADAERRATLEEMEALQALIDAERALEEGLQDLDEDRIAQLNFRLRQRSKVRAKVLHRHLHREHAHEESDEDVGADEEDDGTPAARDRSALRAELKAKRLAAARLREAEIAEMEAMQRLIDAEAALDANKADLDAAEVERLRQASAAASRRKMRMLKRRMEGKTAAEVLAEEKAEDADEAGSGSESDDGFENPEDIPQRLSREEMRAKIKAQQAEAEERRAKERREMEAMAADLEMQVMMSQGLLDLEAAEAEQVRIRLMGQGKRKVKVMKKKLGRRKKTRSELKEKLANDAEAKRVGRQKSMEVDMAQFQADLDRQAMLLEAKSLTSAVEDDEIQRKTATRGKTKVKLMKRRLKKKRPVLGENGVGGPGGLPLSAPVAAPPGAERSSARGAGAEDAPPPVRPTEPEAED